MKSLFSIGKTGFLHGLQVLDNTELSNWITSSDGPLYSGKFIYTVYNIEILHVSSDSVAEMTQCR